jgi:hypothetical protein
VSVGIVDSGFPAATCSKGTAGTARKQSDPKTVDIHREKIND